MLRQKFLPDACHVFPLTGVSILSSEAQPEASGVEYVSCDPLANSNSVSAIDTATRQLIATIPVGQRPRGIAVAPNGEIYATCVQSGTTAIINPSTLTVVATISTGDKPWEVAIAGDAGRAFVSNAYSNNVSVIDTTTHRIITTLPTGRGPHHVGELRRDQALRVQLQGHDCNDY